MTHANSGDHLLDVVEQDRDCRDAAAERRFMLEHRRPAALIDARIADTLAAGALIDATLAHSIAEAAAPEPDSELAEFLVYDILRPVPVLEELDALRDILPTAWFDALRAFVENARVVGFPGNHVGTEARPHLYVTRGTCILGAWLDATVDDRTLLECLLALPGDPDDRRWTVRARMGFYDVYPMTSPELWMMNQVAQGIDRHGEAYAAYVEYSMQQGMSELDFVTRYRGHVPTLDHFVFDLAEQNGWLDVIADANASIGVPGVVRIDVDALREHVFSNGYAYEAGQNGFHIFGPPSL